MDRKYVAFISYRHAEMDSAIAKTIHTLIEQYRIPKGLRKDGKSRLGLVFRDEEELHTASDLTAEIQTALENTEYLIVICSENAIQSPWVGREIDYFLRTHDRSKILAVLASGEPSEVFPPQLTLTQNGELIEPLAMDARADTISGNKKKIRKEIPRLISAMLDCPYDALVMREQKRKTRRITAIAAAIMAVLLGFTSTVLVKNHQIALVNTQLETKNIELDQANTDLSQANTALAEQKAAVQLRESQLLTQNALEDMANADYDSAIENALAALPQDEDDDRPYYPQAEAILMNALGIFRTTEGEVALNTTTLQQVTNIADYAISKDGNRIITVDSFGTMFCFDTNSGDPLWNQYASQEDAGSSTNPHLVLCSDDQTVLRSGSRFVSAYDIQTGALLWSTEIGAIKEDYLFYHEQRNSVLLANYRSVDIFSSAYELTEVDVATGKVLQTIPLAISENSKTFSFSSPATDALSKGGIISKDGSCFYGIFLDDTSQMYLFCADLTNGTSQIIYTQDKPMDYYTAVSGMVISDGALYVVLRDPGENIIFRAVKFDLQTNRPVWQKDIITDDLFYSHYRKDFALFFQKGILIACNNDLYYLDANTGEILCQRTAPSVITSMTFVSDREFGFSLDNGSYGIGWTIHPDTIALTTDPDRQVYTTTKEHTDFRVWGGGIVQLDLDDDGFWLGVGNPVSPGYILLIPENAQNTLEIIRPVYPMAVMNHASVNLPEVGLRLNYNFSIQQAGAQLAMSPFYTSGNPNNLYCLLDPETLTVVNTFQSEKSYSSSELFWLPDTLLPLICNSYDGIFTVDTNGNQTLLYDPAATQEELGKEDEWLSSYTFFRCASEYLSDGKTLLTAACNPKTLQIWRNGVALSETDIPESLIVPAKETSGKKRMLMVGSNGWILTSLHDDYNEPIPAENIAAYNSQENSWTLLQSNAFFANEQVIAIAKSKPLMAGMDQAGDLQLLDLKTGNTLGHFSTQLSSGSVLQMQFFHDDTYLAINATGGHLLIYEVATGKQVYRNQLSNLSSYTLQVFEDLKHGRLYLNCGSGNGLCLDMDTWTTLAQMDNFMYYHADTNRVYLSNSYGSTSPLASGQVPDTAELVKLATDVLAENK